MDGLLFGAIQVKIYIYIDIRVGRDILKDNSDELMFGNGK